MKFLFVSMMLGGNFCYSSEVEIPIFFKNESKSRELVNDIVNEAILEINSSLYDDSFDRSDFNVSEFQGSVKSIPIISREFIFIKKRIDGFEKGNKITTILLSEKYFSNELVLTKLGIEENYKIIYGLNVEDNINKIKANKNILYLENINSVEEYLVEGSVVIDDRYNSLFKPIYFLESNSNSDLVLNEIRNIIEIMILNGRYYEILMDREY